jgi:hypothetical protein
LAGSFSKIFGLSLAKIWKRDPGKYLKEDILDDWLWDLQKDERHDPSPEYLDYHVVIEISSCKGHCRRISLWDILHNASILKYLDLASGEEFADLIEKFDKKITVCRRMAAVEQK